MIQLLKTEFKKFRHNSTVSLLFYAFAILFPFIILIGKSFLNNPQPPVPTNRIFFEFPTVWEFQGYIGSWLVFVILGYMVLHMFTTEVSYKTMRQNIITGYTKKDFFISKVLVIVCLSLFATALYFISCLILGKIHTPNSDFELTFHNDWASVRFFIMSMAYMSFALLMAVLLRRGGLAMFLYFAVALILEPIAKGVIYYYFKSNAMNYLPLNLIEDLMPSPIIRMTSDYIEQGIGVESLTDFATTIPLAIVYTLMFIGLAWWRFNKSDI